MENRMLSRYEKQVAKGWNTSQQTARLWIWGYAIVAFLHAIFFCVMTFKSTHYNGGWYDMFMSVCWAIIWPIADALLIFLLLFGLGLYLIHFYFG
jgi:hypothetical protein